MIRQIAWVFVSALLVSVAPAQKSRADATTDLAEWLQVPMIGDYAVMYGNNWMLDKDTREVANNIAQRWRILSLVARFFSDPRNIQDDLRLYQAAHLTLDRAVLDQLAEKYESKDLFSRFNSDMAFQGLSEFKRRSLAQLLRTEYLAAMQARVPSEPIRIVDIKKFQLGEYDFDKQHFPYLENGGSRPAKLDTPPFGFLAVNTYNNPVPVHVDSLPTVIPDALPIPVEEAEAFVAMLSKSYPHKRAVYVAHLGIFKGFEMREDAMFAVVDSVAAALYADVELKTGITSFPITQRVDPAVAEQEAREAAEAAEREAEQAAAAAAQARAEAAEDAYAQALAAARARVADLDLAILGVKLGMTADEAKAALFKVQPAFEGRFAEMQTAFDVLEADGVWPSNGNCTAFDIRTPRRDFQARSKGLSGAARAKLAEEIVSGMPAKCAPTGVQSDGSMHATVSFRDGKITDSIRIYLGSSDSVIAMARFISVNGLKVDLRGGSIERFGDPILTTADGTVYWPSSPDIIARATLDKNLLESCFPGKKLAGVSRNPVSLDDTRITQACGPALGASYADGTATFFLFDSDRLVQAREDAEADAAQKAEPEEPPFKIEF